MPGSFKLGRAVNTPLSFGKPDPVAIADFDNDGAGDVAVASPGGSKFQLGIYLNDGDQTFSEKLVLNDVPEQEDLATGDLNGDGNADLVQASSDNTSATVLFGDGTGAFPTRTQLQTTHNPKSVTLADIDGDGHDDVLVGTNNRGGVAVFLGDGQGGFTEAAGLVENVRRAPTLGTADFNNDGDLDVITHDDGRTGTVQLLAGDGQGGFSLSNSIDLTDGFSNARDLALGDFDHDGNVDWAVAEKRQDKVEIMFGDGSGGVSTRRELSTDKNPAGLDLADFDGDGEADLAVTHQGSQTVRLYQGAQDGSFTLAEDAAVNGDLDNVNQAASGDLDGDGLPDLVLSNASNGGVISALENLGDENIPTLSAELQWTKQIGTDGQDKVVDTAVTSTGDLVVVSLEKIRSGDDRVAVEKFDAQGNEIWSRSFGNANTNVNAVELDAQDNIYFTGSVTLGEIGSLSNHFSTLNSGEGNYNGEDPYIAKFSPQGEQQWFERFGSPDVDGGVTDLTVTDGGTAYVSARATGPFVPSQQEPDTTNAIAVNAFSSGGNLNWSTLIGSGGSDNAGKIALDPKSGELVVAGRSSGDLSSIAIGGGNGFTSTPNFTGETGDNHDGFLLRLDPSHEGQVTSLRQFEFRSGADSLDGLDVNGSGQATIVGDAGNEGLDAGRGTPLVSVQIPFARRFDSDNSDLWTRQDSSRNDVSIGQDGYSDVVRGPAGFTYVSGGAQAHVGVYNAQGRLVSEITDTFFSQAGGTFDDGAATISADGMSLYVGGGTTNDWAGTALGEKDGWLARLDVSLSEPGGGGDSEPEPEPSPEPQSPQAKVFLTPGAGFSLADAAEVFGAAAEGDRVFLDGGVAGVETDANVERLDLDSDFADLAFQVTDNGLEISNGDVTILTLPSLNQPLDLHFADGNATLTQTGAQRFDLSGGSGGSTTVETGGPADTSGVSLGSSPAARPGSEGENGPAANIFLNADSTFTVGEPARVFGTASGQENIILADSATGVETDANIERLDIAETLSTLDFTVTDDGLQIADGGAALATLPSLNQAADLRFSNGDATLRQTGAQAFELTGGSGGNAEIDTDGADLTAVSLGNAVAQPVTLAGVAGNGTDDGLA